MKTQVQKAWSKSVNDTSNWSYKDGLYGNKVPGELQAVHYLVYNIVRELPPERGFTRNEEFDQLANRVARMVERADIGQKGIKTMAQEAIRSNYLKHFGGLVTIEEFVQKAKSAYHVK